MSRIPVPSHPSHNRAPSPIPFPERAASPLPVNPSPLRSSTTSMSSVSFNASSVSDTRRKQSKRDEVRFYYSIVNAMLHLGDGGRINALATRVLRVLTSVGYVRGKSRIVRLPSPDRESQCIRNTAANSAYTPTGYSQEDRVRACPQTHHIDDASPETATRWKALRNQGDCSCFEAQPRAYCTRGNHSL